MSLTNNYSLNTQFNSQISFREKEENAPILAKPINKVESAITNTVDTFVKQPEDEEKKKSNKTAISVGSTVLVLTGLVALLNPKFSGKLVNKMKTMSSQANVKLEKNKGNVVKSNFYKTSEKVWGKVADFLQFTNTMNAWKDVGFKKLCTETKGIKTVMTKPHKAITRWFDALGKHTVQWKYSNANKNLRSLEDLISHYKDKLPASEQKALETKLNEARKVCEYFSKDKTATRLVEQEKVMSNLEKDFFGKMKSYGKDLWNNNWQGKKATVKNNMSFWAEDMLMPARNKLEKDGMQVVDKIMGDGKAQKGTYHEIIDILSPHISKEEMTVLEKSLAKANKNLRKANHSETVEYFDKKRDLVLGGAPTDIMTAIFGIGMSGLAIGVADTKEERVSRALTVGFPAIAGIGASMAFTAMLFSGIQGMIYGSLASIGLSKVGSIADKIITPRIAPKEAKNV